jgi:hypothetical protein
MTRSDLLEIIDDRAANKATIITSQLPIDHWHAWIGDATIADAILDRILQHHHRLTLTGDSLRLQRAKNIKRRKTWVHRDRQHYNLGAQHQFMRSGHDNRNWRSRSPEYALTRN